MDLQEENPCGLCAEVELKLLSVVEMVLLYQLSGDVKHCDVSLEEGLSEVHLEKAF